MTRSLYQIHDNGAKYWVVADTWQRAEKMVAEQEDRDDFADPPHIYYPTNEKDARAVRFRMDGDGETCSMWMAYLLVRDHAETILACSEWP